MSRWGTEGPPPEAYSRVTNPERFQPLHDVALRLLERLESTFDVKRVAGYGLDREIERVDLARPTVRLVPVNRNAAPLAIAFTAFPGVIVRAGRWCVQYFPNCGCDACDDDVDEEGNQLNQLADDVTAGRFRESIHLPLVGDGWQEYKLWSEQGRSGGLGRIDRSRALQMLAKAGQASLDWALWPPRESTVDADPGMRQ